LAGTIIDLRLFGSVAKGTDTQELDIDILVLVENDDRITIDIRYGEFAGGQQKVKKTISSMSCRL